MQSRPRSSLLLWLPVVFPLGSGVAAAMLGLPHLPVDLETAAFLLIGAWGSAAGVFTALVLSGSRVRGALSTFLALAVASPPILLVLTALVATPVVFVLHLREVTADRMALVVMSCWFLLSAGLSVELLDRLLLRQARS